MADVAARRVLATAPFFRGEILGGKKQIRDLSEGNQAKVGIAAALLVRPKLLVLDEPFAHFDPSSQLELNRLLLNQQQVHGTTVLLSSHGLAHLQQICDRVLLLEKGQLRKDLPGKTPIFRARPGRDQASAFTPSASARFPFACVLCLPRPCQAIMAR
jgi:ABC-type multidrug transport system ATPase subunit